MLPLGKGVYGGGGRAARFAGGWGIFRGAGRGSRPLESWSGVKFVRQSLHLPLSLFRGGVVHSDESGGGTGVGVGCAPLVVHLVCPPHQFRGGCVEAKGVTEKGDGGTLFGAKTEIGGCCFVLLRGVEICRQCFVAISYARH
ncbi:hypothetical protein CEXT_734701 [Caerostris extrusa]|uniref:Uncharacterized protein n=1 Tax=Caerostris extrusa TaxID=172846 RepID=A0AAV4N566_CAEEX|nr:hypothetical protein CEXT_734701 [Caerostris extrusa]